MTKPFIFLILFVLFFLPSCGQNNKESFWVNLPDPINWVSDFENIFTKDEKSKLDSLIADYEKRTSVEIAVITIPAFATEKEKFDDLTLLIGKSWGVGKKEKNNGILIGISLAHRKIRIQNGLGIEKIMTDIQTQKIIDEIIVPHFKAGDYYKGIFEAIQNIKYKLDNNKTKQQ
jgi:uncharacterized protein